MRAVVLIAAALATIPSARAAPRHLTLAEMGSLAWAAVHSVCPSIPRHVISFETSSQDGFIVFEALGILPGSVSVHPCLPFYDIDPGTGEIWDASSDCSVVTSPAIRRLQAQLRARIGLTAARYKRFRLRGPMCDQG